MQPKQPGPAAPQLPQQGTAEAGPNSLLTAGTSFLGAQVSESGFIPPDSMGSVGPTQALVSVNGRIKVFDKQGNLGALDVTDAIFWSSVSNGSDVTDPGVEYDRLSGRWIVSAVNLEATNNRVMIAVSNGPTITDSSSFTFFFFNQNAPSPPGDSGLFADYPQLGVDKNAVYVGVNDFGSSFSNTSAFVIRKSSVTGGGPIVVTAFRGLATGNGPGVFSPQPATDMDPNANEGYIVGSDNQSFSQLDIRRISDPGGTPSISGTLTVPVPSTYSPISVPQGTHGSLDALDDRLFGAMIARDPGGNLSLWTAHNIRVGTTGVGGSGGNRDADRWYQLGNLSATPTLTQSGTLFDSAASNPRSFWIPSIAANGQGHASLNSSTAGSGLFASVASSGHLASDAAGVTDPFDITQTSSSSYQLGSGTPKRWGDYSQTVVDPTDNQTFWTFQEYANAADSWGVRVIKLKAPPPATPTAVSPNPVSNGSSVIVQVTGTSANGSGFFDPGADSGGPGFANHISASVSGGVSVIGTTYIDPTHVTLDLNTNAASNGAKDVTVTNPDGQSSTASNLLSVGGDTTPPVPPTFSATSPASPANNNSPKILGSAEAGSTVKLYTDAACTGGLAGTGTASAFASPGVTTAVADNSNTTFYATATDAANNTSACSPTSITYVEDSTAPSAPASLATSPATASGSPSNDINPEVSGAAEAGSTVKVYKAPTTSDCSAGNLGATGSAAGFAAPGLTVTVPVNATTTLRATATDAAGNTSACSSASVNYFEDSSPPAAPSSLTVSPASPANNNSPAIQGSAEAGSTVNLFTTASCSGPPVATGTAAAFATPGLTASVANDTTTTFRATATDAAGNTSSCSSGVAYVEDSTPPASPSALASSPISPANDNSPEISGTAEAGSTVKVYAAPTTSDCTAGNLAAANTAAAFASPGLTVSASDNTTTTFRATATDAAGNTSGCSSASVSYVEDSNPPAQPSSLAVSPASPANNNSPQVSGSAEAGSTVKLYRAPTSSDCTPANLAATGTAAAFASPGLTGSVSDNSTTTFRATATDAAGNISGCSSASVSYVEDSNPPAQPSSLAVSPASPANNNSPVVSGSAEAGSTVKLYAAPTTSDCTAGNLLATGSAAAFASPGLTASVADNTTTTFRATATDAVGNTSTCSSGVGYVEDSNPPAAPTGLTSSPASPANDNSPEISGSAEAGSTVNLYATAGCTGSPVATGSAAGFSSPGLTVAVSDNSTNTFKATATDPVGNVSPCSSSSVTYQEDSTIPVAPTLSGTSPASPANNNSPKILGSAAAGSTVKLYTDAACTGGLAGTGTAAAFAAPGIPVAVADNSTTTFYATATDVNTSACSPSSATYVEDSNPPVASIDTGPSGTTNDHAPTFTFSSEPGAAFQCSVDTGTPGFGACSGPGNSYTPSPALPDGAYTFRVRATDQAGNTGAAAVRAFTIVTPNPPDLSPPETIITKGPKKKTRKRRPSFAFAASELGSSFQCQLDSGPFQPCTSPFRPSAKLKFRKHFFRVEAIDPANNVDGTPAVVKFKVFAKP
ncbi:MAG: hypothetical protein QOD60_1920 [Solirubrobacterales bacterium]|nr:hypothetical protein [Solirubrobacterales bacterium]